DREGARAMKAPLPILLAFLAAAPLVAATEVGEDGVNERAPRDGVPDTRFLPPPESEIPDDAFGALVRRGRAIFVDTTNQAREYVGNGMACANCHLEQGRRADSAPLWAAYTMYPAYRSK